MRTSPIDTGTRILAAITLLLFLGALFTKGLTHDMFLEGAVFLVSLKLIIMSYKNSVSVNDLDRKLDRLLNLLEKTGEGDAKPDDKPRG